MVRNTNSLEATLMIDSSKVHNSSGASQSNSTFTQHSHGAQEMQIIYLFRRLVQLIIRQVEASASHCVTRS